MNDGFIPKTYVVISTVRSSKFFALSNNPNNLNWEDNTLK